MIGSVTHAPKWLGEGSKILEVNFQEREGEVLVWRFEEDFVGTSFLAVEETWEDQINQLGFQYLRSFFRRNMHAWGI